LGKPDVVVLVAELQGRVVGYAFGGIEGPDYMALRGPAGVVYDLVVDPTHRRSGIGSMLLERMVAALDRRGVPQIVLPTAEKNEAAQRLFARMGFRRTMIEMARGRDQPSTSATPQTQSTTAAPESES
jgi:ribosomal protein S18 acetylase RimI-like enzyme